MGRLQPGGLAVIETHPIQYHAPVYREVQQRFGIPVTVIYGSDFSVAGYPDQEFGVTFAWDTDLLSGYTPLFLSQVAHGGARSAEALSTRHIGAALRTAAPRAVLVAGYHPRFHYAALYQAWRAGRPILFRGETNDLTRRRNPLKALIRDRALSWVYHRCSRLLFVGRRSLDHFRRLGCPPEKLLFSPYCVDTGPFQCDEAARARFRPAAREGLGVADGQTVVLFSGKLSDRKGPDLLLSAVKQLPDALRQRMVVVFLGSGELRPLLTDLARRPPEVNALFLGFHNQTQLSRYYHAADLLVLPSRHSETWGLVVNEALHHGLPCVVSEGVGCAPDLIVPGATGAVCRTGSATSLAGGLQTTLGLAGRADVRERCRRQVSGYTVEKAAEGIAEAYTALAE
jgi:glycosyltransferase involved in cell wall biosynthesis